jgi:hypothetical protein
VPKTLLLAAFVTQFALVPLRADDEIRKRLIRFFGGWYSWFPSRERRA